MNIRFLHSTFTGGEVTPEFYGRVNDAKFGSGAGKLRNFISLPHGPARNRPGTEFVTETKYKNKRTRLIRFTFSTTQTLVIEMGEGYFRFVTNGAVLVNDDGTPYEVANSYTEKDIFDVKYVQSADIMTLTHPSYPTMELARYGALDWRFTQVRFNPTVTPPNNLSSTASCKTANYYYSYVVTSVGADKTDESGASVETTVFGNLLDTGAFNTINWGVVSGAKKYKVYKKASGVYGYIGTATTTTFKDDYIAPNTAKTPPEHDITFSAVNDYPGATTYFEQRRCFASSNNSPQTLWMTKTGTESNMGMGVVSSDSDAIEVRIATRDANTIRHIVPLSSLVILTSSAELICSSATSGPVTQSSIMIKPQAYVGASQVQPVIVNNIILYVAARGNHVRELGYDWQAGGMVTGDVSLRAPHFFDGKVITDMAFSASPYPICWVTNNEGTLLGMTYIPEQDVGGWHAHETDGKYKSVAVVTENDDDRLYVIVEREINGEKVQYIERMADMLFTDLEHAFFVDSGLSYEGPPVQTLSGLTHLEGKTVSILADGAVHPQLIVEDGRVTLDVPASIVHIGLPYDGVLKTLPAVGNFVDTGMGTGRSKNVNKAYIRVYRTSGVYAGPDENSLVEYKQRKDEPLGSPPGLISEEIEIVPKGLWGDSGQLTIVQKDPLPITVVSATLEIAMGG